MTFAREAHVALVTKKEENKAPRLSSCYVTLGDTGGYQPHKWRREYGLMMQECLLLWSSAKCVSGFWAMAEEGPTGYL